MLSLKHALCTIMYVEPQAAHPHSNTGSEQGGTKQPEKAQNSSPESVKHLSEVLWLSQTKAIYVGVFGHCSHSWPPPQPTCCLQAGGGVEACPGHCYCRSFVQELLGLGSAVGPQSKRCQGQRGDVLTTLYVRILAGNQSLPSQVRDICDRKSKSGTDGK